MQETCASQRFRRIGTTPGLLDRNTSGFKGVTWDKSRGKWKAMICLNDKRVNLGRFDDLEAAHAAYVAASKSLHGEFGRAA